MIYLVLRGRIGNQLFEYAIAETIRQELSENTIIIDDSEVVELNWKNSLIEYQIKDVQYIHSHKEMNKYLSRIQIILFKLYHKVVSRVGFKSKFRIEKTISGLFNYYDIVACENGYLPYSLKKRRTILLDGYFQSEKYFYNYKSIISEILGTGFENALDIYSGIETIRNRESICISIKVEHNVGSSLYDVCTKDYWEKAIGYICKKVSNPLFFICSDNVPYVLENFIDAEKYDYVIQDSTKPVHISLAAMSECKHFIIGNTTFGWWAQYLSKNPEKIVVAPSKWMAVDMPIDIYQDNWHLIEV